MDSFPWHLVSRVDRSALLVGQQLRALLGADARQGLRRWGAACLGGAAAEVTLTRAWPTADLPVQQRIAAAVRIALAGPAGQGALLAFDHQIARTIVSSQLGVPLPPLLAEPSRVERGLLEYAVAALLAELADCPWSVVPGRAGADLSAPADGFVFEARVRCAATTGLGWLVVGHAALLGSGGPRRVAPGRARRIAAARVECAVLLGGFRLALGEAQPGALSAGDVIVASTCPAPGTERGILVVGQGGFPVIVRLADAASGRVDVEVAGAFERGVNPMSELTEEQGAAVAEEIPVDVAIEVGRVRLTGAQVMALGEGDVITLDRPVGAEVDLRIGGRLLARGELVAVDGEAGVRLTEVPE